MSLLFSQNRGRSGHAAHNTLFGQVSNGATWSESMRVLDASGIDVTGITAHSFELQVREAPTDTSATLTLSTADSTLSVAESNGVTTLTIAGAQDDISALDGEYVVDIVSKTGTTLTHRYHGLVTFKGDPIAF